MPGNRGNSNFYFLCGSVFGSNAAVSDGLGAGMDIPIVQKYAIVQII